MNLTIGNARVSSWKNIKAQYVAAACGLALAAAAVTGLGARQDSAPAAPMSQPQRVSVSAPWTLPMPQLVFFIAASEQEATDHIAQLRMDLNPEASISYAYRVVTNAGEEAQAVAATGLMAAELANVGTRFQVIDLRLGIMPDGQRQASAANIASQVAAERAALTTLQEQVLVALSGAVPAPQVSDAYIDAAILSTELATHLP